MQINIKKIILIIFLIILESISITLLKKSSVNNNKLYIISLIIYILILYILFFLFKKNPISIIFTLWNMGTIIMISLIGWFYYKQKLNNYQLIGLLMALLSIPLLNYN